MSRCVSLIGAPGSSTCDTLGWCTSERAQRANQCHGAFRSFVHRDLRRATHWDGAPMSLPVPNLDDRKFQDIVDEAKRKIPTLCPEWTNHNVSDPGVALIELFAWMSEMIIFRLNQTPDKLYTQFLNLLGVRPFPSQPATVDLTFWLSAPTNHVVNVPAGTQASTAAVGQSEVFATTTDLRIEQPTLVGALTGHGETGLVDVFDELRYD